MSSAAPKQEGADQPDEPGALARPGARAQVPLPGRRARQATPEPFDAFAAAPGGRRNRGRVRADARRRASSRARPISTRAIARFARNWSINRMPVIDRNILRIGAFELLGDDPPPRSVVINEAIELAKRFSTADSGKFINGILDKIGRAERRRSREGGSLMFGKLTQALRHGPQEDEGQAPRRASARSSRSAASSTTQLIDEMEETLFVADLGPKTVQEDRRRRARRVAGAPRQDDGRVLRLPEALRPRAPRRARSSGIARAPSGPDRHHDRGRQRLRKDDVDRQARLPPEAGRHRAPRRGRHVPRRGRRPARALERAARREARAAAAGLRSRRGRVRRDRVRDRARTSTS